MPDSGCSCAHCFQEARNEIISGLKLWQSPCSTSFLHLPKRWKSPHPSWVGMASLVDC